MIFIHENLLERLQMVEGNKYERIIWADGVIYGIGGLNRYFVNRLNQGKKKYEEYEPWEIVFSAFHSNEEGIKKAESVGFRIFH